MSRVVWDAENGWHDGPTVRVAVDERGRLAAIGGRGVSTIRRTFGDGRVATFRGVIVKRSADAVLLREAPDRCGWLHIGTHTAPDPRWSMTTEVLP